MAQDPGKPPQQPVSPPSGPGQGAPSPGMAPSPQPQLPQQQPQQGPGMQPQGPGAGEDVVRQGLSYIYGDGRLFNETVKMLEKGKGDLPSTVAMITNAIGDKMEADMGRIDTASLQEAGVAIVINLFDLAQKAGIIETVDKREAAKAWALTLQTWMQQHPDRVDPQAVQESARQLEKMGMAGMAGEMPDDKAKVGPPLEIGVGATEKGLLEEV